jgi:hypothetical protein
MDRLGFADFRLCRAGLFDDLAQRFRCVFNRVSQLLCAILVALDISLRLLVILLGCLLSLLSFLCLLEPPPG